MFIFILYFTNGFKERLFVLSGNGKVKSCHAFGVGGIAGGFHQVFFQSQTVEALVVMELQQRFG